MADIRANQSDRRWSFDRDATVYEGGRPPYPARTYEFMAEIGALQPARIAVAEVDRTRPAHLDGDILLEMLDADARLVEDPAELFW